MFDKKIAKVEKDCKDGVYANRPWVFIEQVDNMFTKLAQIPHKSKQDFAILRVRLEGTSFRCF